MCLNLMGFRVCNEFVIKTFDVSNKRLQNVVENIQKVTSGVAVWHLQTKEEKVAPNKMSQ